MQRSSHHPSDRQQLFFQILVVLIILLGIVLRASKYIPNWSMRGDELAVTLNLIDRTYIELVTKPLDYEQAAPFGYLLIVKALILSFGTSEYVLRLAAFLSGCVSLVLMYRLLSRTSEKYGTILALLAFACSYYLIYYSAELKQYAGDVLISIVLALLFHRQITTQTSQRDFWQLGSVGALTLCFSHPAIFVLVGMGVTLFIFYLQDRQRLTWVTCMGAAWAAVFLAIYLGLLRFQTSSEYLITFWRDLNSFMPMPPWQDLVWFPATLEHLFVNIAGFSGGIRIILLLLFAYGLWVFWKNGSWQWSMATVLIIGLNMLASGFEKFPFHGRLITYLVPFVFVIFAKAVDGLMALINNRVAANTAFIALMILLLRPAIPTANNFLFTKSYLQDDLKPVLAFIAGNAQEDDLIYAYHYTDKQFDYYAAQYGLDGLTVIQGQDYSRNAKKYDDEIAALPHGRRIWFVFTFVGETRIEKGKKQDEREYILNYLDQNASLLDEFHSTNNASSTHLFILK